MTATKVHFLCMVIWGVYHLQVITFSEGTIFKLALTKPVEHGCRRHHHQIIGKLPQAVNSSKKLTTLVLFII